MDEFLKHLRNNHDDFNHGALVDQLKGESPYTLFKSWYQDAYDVECPLPNAMTLSTVDEFNIPSSRIVFMKELVDKGLIFYTNYKSKKGNDIYNNPNVSVLFFWEKLSRQIRIQGKVEKIDEEISDDYFESRPRKSKIGAWASQQSQEVANRSLLEKEVLYFTKKFEGKPIPRPSHWGGYLIRPFHIEFWQGRPSRLHDRICFKKEKLSNKAWSVFRSNP